MEARVNITQNGKFTGFERGDIFAQTFALGFVEADPGFIENLRSVFSATGCENR
jgi:hypothetical protein